MSKEFLKPIGADQPLNHWSASTAQGRRQARLAFLALDLASRQPGGTTLYSLIAWPLPLLWRQQREALHARR